MELSKIASNIIRSVSTGQNSIWIQRKSVSKILVLKDTMLSL
ncbi:hypothetical protein QZH41_013746 [Actinostola sp. cb2023]|nr:hypothetical protein QZH41_013746 [Actinostola sp. cb2023]